MESLKTTLTNQEKPVIQDMSNWHALLWSSLVHLVIFVAIFISQRYAASDIPPITLEQVEITNLQEEDEQEILQQEQKRPALQRASAEQLAALVPDDPLPELHYDAEVIEPQAYYTFAEDDFHAQGKQRNNSQLSLPETVISESFNHNSGQHDTANVLSSKLINERKQRLQQACQFLKDTVFRDPQRSQQLDALLRRYATTITNERPLFTVFINPRQEIYAARLMGSTGVEELDQWLQQVIADTIRQEFIGLPPLTDFSPTEYFTLPLR